MRLTLVLLVCGLASAAEWPAPVESDWTAHDFKFHGGESLGEVRLHYRTVGDPHGVPVVVLHGTNQTGAVFFNQQFAGELFGTGQPLDAKKFFIIAPDALGSGRSSKPSDGLRTAFPKYNYADMVLATHRLLTEGLGLRHVAVVIGNSMGGMETWLYGEMYPDYMDAIVPMASEPSAMGGRNWLMRRMVIDAIRNDPAWKGGMYAEQPAGMRVAQVFYNFATSGGAEAIYARLSDAAKANAEADRLLKQRAAGDANDTLYGMEASEDYDPSRELEKIQARVLAINSADDERNPAGLGVMEAAMKRLAHGQYVLIPVGPQTRGHGTTANARFWKDRLGWALGEN